MPPKKLRSDMNGNIQPELKFPKKPPRKYVPGIIEQYIREREEFINDDKAKQWLYEHRQKD